MKKESKKRPYSIISIEDKFKKLVLKNYLFEKMEEVNLSEVNTDDIRFTYRIDLDFKVVYDKGWFELDLIDLALFQVIAKILTFTKQKPHTVEGIDGEWLYLDEERIMLECPFIPLSSSVAIRSRMRKLENRNLLEACPANKTNRLKYFRLGMDAYVLSGITKK